MGNVAGVREASLISVFCTSALCNEPVSLSRHAARYVLNASGPFPPSWDASRGTTGIEACILSALDELALVNGLTALIRLCRITVSAAVSDPRHRQVQQLRKRGLPAKFWIFDS